ncbi:hypothetical protein BDZ89DRAFT_1231808 [Hymenopellis radicata]|nr:hypothetical protein BDZ89DRAFT_1231808 [Hymenopellis radicata]
MWRASFERAEKELYAVEKWVVSRDRPYPLLVVYTADTAHTVVLDALIPSTPDDMKEAVHSMRRDARPKQTTYGTVMVTSLAHFRSDYTIVLVPEGDFRKAREQMYVNINLLRLGSAGRTALTLNHPSETTVNGSAEQVKFNQTVLDLVKHTQTALGIFGFNVDRDGLLCDTTLTALQSWTSQYHPSERVPSPNVVSALFSLVFAVRNRLAAMHHLVPKDPFASPQLFPSRWSTLPITRSQRASDAHSYASTPNECSARHSNTPTLYWLCQLLPSFLLVRVAINVIGDLQVFVGTLIGREKDGQSLRRHRSSIGKRSKEEDKDIGGV